MMRVFNEATPWRLVGLTAFVSVMLVLLFPMMTDEAYYMTWAQRSTWPDIGFFDHPPFVSWQAGLARLWSDVTAARIGVLAASVVAFVFQVRIGLMLFAHPLTAWLAALVAQTTFGALANSFLVTPDSGLLMWWTIGVHEAMMALQKDPKRWLTAGLATGFGLLSKYTMVLIGPVFLWGLIQKQQGRQLKTPWPYLGGVVALLVIIPHLWWNSQHDWITLRFQFGHGMSVRQQLVTGSSLPAAYDGGVESRTQHLYQDLQKVMSDVPGFAETKKRSKPPRSKLEQAWQYVGDFLGGVIGLWGAYALWTMVSWLRDRRREQNHHTIALVDDSRPAWALISAAMFFPLIFFAVLSPFTKIEANWPAMHMMAGAMILVRYRTVTRRVILGCLVFHAACAFVLVALARHPEWIPRARDNRLVVETSGYDQLAQFIRERTPSQFLAVDSYQLKSALAIRAPELQVVQWPGITRSSEYTRGSLDDLAIEQAIIRREDFWLLTFDDLPPELPGFVPVNLEGIRSCPDGSIGAYSIRHPYLPCEKGLREWWLVTYTREILPNREGDHE